MSKSTPACGQTRAQEINSSSSDALEAASLARRLEPAVARVSAVLRKLGIAASSQLGRDCYPHAELGRVLLSDLGIQARSVVGFAAWRVGDSAGEVPGHTPSVQGYAPPGVSAIAYHTWLEYRGLIIDFTTYQLRLKAQQLDLCDGGHTSVTWCPDFLLLPRTEARSYDEVAAAPHAGVAYYEARPELEPVLRTQFALEPPQVQTARFVLANPQLRVVGPNNAIAVADAER
jgi:hypothetical protein